MIFFVFIFLSLSEKNNCITINFNYLLEAEKQVPVIEHFSKNESYESYYSRLFITHDNISLKLSFEHPNFEFTLKELKISNDYFNFGLIDLELGGYIIASPSAKMNIFPKFAVQDPGNYFGLELDLKNFHVIAGGRENNKYILYLSPLFNLNYILINPYIQISGQDNYSNTKQSYIYGSIFKTHVFKLGIEYVIDYYFIKIKSYNTWFSLNYDIKDFNVLFDIYYKNTDRYYSLQMYENDLICSSASLRYKIYKDFSLMVNTNYIQRETSVLSKYRSVDIGILYNQDEYYFHSSMGYEYPEGIIIKCGGSINYSFFY